MFLPITALLACGLSALLLILSQRVIQQRRRVGASLGDGGDQWRSRAIRAHANLTEYAPLFVILLGLAEAMGGNTLVLSLTAFAFGLGRLMHGYALAFSAGSPMGRSGGMLLTLGTFVIIIACVSFLVVAGR